MGLFSVNDIITRAAETADMHDLFVKPSTWLNWLNAEMQSLFTVCARGGWALRNITLRSIDAATDLTSGSASIPTEFLAIAGCWEIDGSGRYRPLTFTQGIDAQRQFPGAKAITGHATEFWIADHNGSSSEDTQVYFYPFPTSGTYIVAIVNAPTKLTSVESTFTLPMGLEELLVLKLARRALIKEESDPSMIDKLLQIKMQDVEEYLWSRNLANAPKVRNVDATERGWGWTTYLNYLPASQWIYV